MFQTSYVAGGRLDAPHYPTYQVPFQVGVKENAVNFGSCTLEYTVPFVGELYAVSIDCSTYTNDDRWSLFVNGEILCEDIYVKRAPEGINLMAFVEVAPGDKVKIVFTNTGPDKVIWASFQFLKLGDMSKPWGEGQDGNGGGGGFDGIDVPKPVIRLYVFDSQTADGDMLNIYLNGALIRKNVVLVNDAPFPGENGINYIEVPLQFGPNMITFEGVYCGEAGDLTASFRVRDSDGNLLFDTGDLPSLVMERDKASSNGYFPSGSYKVNWPINRTS